MSSGICPTCKVEYKNLGAHRCKVDMKQEPILQTPSINISNTPEAPPIQITEKPMKMQNKLISTIRGIFPKGKSKTPLIIKPHDPNFKPELLSQEDKFKKFIQEAPLWSGYKPTGIRKLIISLFNGKYEIAPCVFVSQKMKPKILYLPYRPEKQIIINPERGFYEVGKNSSPPFFFDLDHSCELINSPNLKDRFNLPADIRHADYARGLDEGVSQGIKDLLNEIMKGRYITYAALIVAVLALVVMALVSYTMEAKYNLIASNLNNLTIEVYKRP